jgi:hypothetical protein
MAQQHLGIKTMNVVPLATSATDPIASEGVVAAGVYVDGRRVADIAVDEASSKMPTMPISGLKSNSTAKPCSSWRGRRN